MKRIQVPVIGGILLIAAGILFLLQNLNIIGPDIALVWAFLFVAGGAIFLYVFLANRTQWWAVIPGFALLGIGALIAISQLAPGLEAWGGALFLGGLGAAFWVVYLTNREYWWAVIPGGVLITLALVAGLSSLLEGIDVSGVFFLGLAATFGLLSFIRTPEGRLKWALVPAIVMLVMGLGFTAFSASLVRYLWPLALIGGGIFLIVRMMRSK
jgi:hypothetical protein